MLEPWWKRFDHRRDGIFESTARLEPIFSSNARNKQTGTRIESWTDTLITTRPTFSKLASSVRNIFSSSFRFPRKSWPNVFEIIKFQRAPHLLPNGLKTARSLARGKGMEFFKFFSLYLLSINPLFPRILWVNLYINNLYRFKKRSRNAFFFPQSSFDPNKIAFRRGAMRVEADFQSTIKTFSTRNSTSLGNFCSLE